MSSRSLVVWLKAACLLTGVVGLIAAGGAHSATREPWRLLFDLVAWPIDGAPGSFGRDAAALSAISGGVMVGWAVLMFGVVSGPVAGGQPRVTRAMLHSVVAWFVVDSLGSVAAGLPTNVVLNACFLALFGPPLWVLLRRSGRASTGGPAR